MIVEHNARKPRAFRLLGGRDEVAHLNTRGDNSESAGFDHRDALRFLTDQCRRPLP